MCYSLDFVVGAAKPHWWLQADCGADVRRFVLGVCLCNFSMLSRSTQAVSPSSCRMVQLRRQLGPGNSSHLYGVQLGSNNMHGWVPAVLLVH